jgi:DNA mismatch repair ATPase MutS
MKHLSSFYKNQQKQFEEQLKTLNKQLGLVTAMRVISFILAFTLLYLFFDQGWLAVAGFFIPMVVLVIFVKRSHILNEHKLQLEQLISIQQQEQMALEYNFDWNATGISFSKKGHAYAMDLGVFGNGSLYQLLNRTVTKGGAISLSNQLLNLQPSKTIIEKRQKSVIELAHKTSWQHQFRANHRETQKEIELEFPSIEVFSNKFMLVLYYLLPLIMMGLLIALIMDLILFSYLLYAALGTLTYSGTFLKKTTEVAKNAEDLLTDISAYTHYIELIEKENFSEELNIENQTQLGGSISASIALKELNKILNGFDNRNNMIMGVVLNAFLLWDVKHLKQFMLWNKKHGALLPKWITAVSEFDARISVANYVYNNPENSFPTILQNTEFSYHSNQLSHPLLKPDVRVPNSISIEGWNQINIVTGANMAGKSTFLRTIGTSMIMASLGASLPGNLSFTPVALFSSMKTEDSLSDNESYFFAELKRLKQLVDLLESGQPTFAILDEILKGTNSKDKATGSAEFLKKLLRYPLSGIIATHDLSLCELNSVYPNNISNYAFEVDMKGDDLHFDYTLKRGVCQNMNATFLLKKMNLID